MRYYSTQRPVAPGTFPKPEGNKVLHIENYDRRTYIPEIGREAWGYIDYDRELTAQEARSYELRPVMHYMNRETGEVLTRQEMVAQFVETYDGDDTNVIGWEEYYEEVAV